MDAVVVYVVSLIDRPVLLLEPLKNGTGIGTCLSSKSLENGT
jgi:hypothetical protein